MKIGIVSLYGWLKLWDNYGTLLQNYALQTHLQRQGHTTYWIRTRAGHASHSASPSLVRRLATLARSAVRWSLSPVLGLPPSARLAAFNRAHPRGFREFMERYVPRTDREYHIEELQASPPEADAYVVGSDQVWRDVTPLNFLDFGGAHVRRVAYAVSAPWPALDDSWLDRARSAISRIDAVAVREVEGVDVCKRIGVPDAVHVIDPTLLLDSEDYVSIFRTGHGNGEVSAPFVLAYFVNVRVTAQIPWESTVGLAALRSLELKVIPLQGAELVIPENYLLVPTPAEWLRAFHDAECVVTNSYHGALFAIIMKKPFLVCLQGGTTAAENCRFTSILEPLGLASRILASEEWSVMQAAVLNEKLSESIDWAFVDEKLAALREASRKFLCDAIA